MDRSRTHSLSADDVVSALNSSSQGLSQDEVQARLAQYGPNILERRAPVSRWQILLRQLKSSVVLLLGVAAVAAFAFDEIIEGFAILIVLVVNTLIGFFMELSSVRSMEALVKLGRFQTTVLRGGQVHKIAAEELVPGDIVLVESGDRLAADMRVIEAARLQSDESALTGESLPCDKDIPAVPSEAGLADRSSMLHKGCLVTEGSGKAIVVNTGMDSELGHITALVEEAKEAVTPLEKRLEKLGTQLLGVIVLITSFIVCIGILRDYPIFLMVEVGIALAVAAIPEGLPVVATIALSRGLMKMARCNALVRELSAVETLGSTTVICTDKTGTLTENKMVATRILHRKGEMERRNDGSWSPSHSDASDLLRTAALCSNVSYDGSQLHGEPTETALIEACLDVGSDVLAIRNSYPERRREPFDSDIKMMATYHQAADGSILVAVKGAPEAIFNCSLSDTEKEKWEQKNQELAAEGFRIIAFAEKNVSSADEDPYSQLNFLGLMALYDPPRADVKDAIQQCKKAGIKVVMVTGDQAPTAIYVARKLGLTEPGEEETVTSKDFPAHKDKILRSKVVTRVAPKDKLDLVSWYQESGNIVAMTGDGINDAPAVKKADIGVVMGIRGTDVAREAADMVLLDDAFSSIVAAVAEGRVIFDNIRDFVRYLLSCNLAEVLIFFLAAVANVPLPILPLQILFLNMVTDVFPALALGVSDGDGRALERPPRPTQEGILTRRIWRGISLHASYLTAATLLAMGIARSYLGLEGEQAVTITFLTLGFSQLWHVFNLRRPRESMGCNHVTSNPYIWGALALCVVLLATSVYLPILATALHTAPISLKGWAVVCGCSLMPVAIDSVVRVFRKSL